MTRRRATGEDSVYRDADRWRGTVSLGYDANGQRVRKKVSGRTRAETSEKLRKLRQQVDSGVVPDDRLTVQAFLDRWLAINLPGSLAASTEDDYVDTVRLHLVPALGRKRPGNPAKLMWLILSGCGRRSGRRATARTASGSCGRCCVVRGRPRPAACWVWLTPWSTMDSTSRAASSSMVPAADSCTPSRPRCSSGVPRTCSSRRICWLRVGWAMNSRSAAWVKVPASATATKYRRCRSSRPCGARVSVRGSRTGSACAWFKSVPLPGRGASRARALVAVRAFATDPGSPPAW
jgi:hypothetical protein